MSKVSLFSTSFSNEALQQICTYVNKSIVINYRTEWGNFSIILYWKTRLQKKIQYVLNYSYRFVAKKQLKLASTIEILSIKSAPCLRLLVIVSYQTTIINTQMNTFNSTVIILTNIVRCKLNQYVIHNVPVTLNTPTDIHYFLLQKVSCFLEFHIEKSIFTKDTKLVTSSIAGECFGKNLRLLQRL